MGGCNFRSDASAVGNISIGDFKLKHRIGKGGFGEVWKCVRKGTKKQFALKMMNKAKIVKKNSVNSTLNERELLAQLKHPFIINMHYAFQDKVHLYIVTDLIEGGDFRYHMRSRKTFTESESKFLIACVVAGLEYMHTNGCLHRDIKPENLLMGEDGYIRITDMGISRMRSKDNASDTSGTPGYMAPEIMCRQNHDVAVDFYALGIIAYELMIGKRPYTGKDRKEIRDNVLKEQASIKKSMIPEGWSIEAADFINKLIQRKPANRIGLNGSEELKQHIWLKDFDWDALLEKRMEPAFYPKPRPPVKPKTLTTEEEERLEKENEEYYQMCRRESLQKIFEDYIFDIEQLKFQKLQEIRQKDYLKKIGKLEEDQNIVTTNFICETQNTNYHGLL
ncbi:unnamed protein product [Moneuplotes crassus]|uniref:non-specific serine/threonine protein kinase n=1 Tax=Euplotes crassus TaxID=5936 RepID=A0AAD1UGQ1_EUPCR|nr:unnamed protein product [Moneuplotes crassus]